MFRIWRGASSEYSQDKKIADSQALLWSSFSFSAGIAVYAILPEEPFVPLLTVAFILAFVAVLRFGRARAVGRVLVLALAFAGGLTAASVRTAWVDAPRLGEAMNATLTGRVLERQADPSGARVVLAVMAVDGRLQTELSFPEKARLRIPGGDRLGVGDVIRVRGRLFPPSGPVSPGGYDFSFRAFFSGIGATGFAYGPAETIETGGGNFASRVAAKVQGLRDKVASKIESVLGDRPETGLAVALLVGDRSNISQDQEEMLRKAGLAHILAISGLHMALFAFGAYGISLFVLALFPALALRWPTHKWAAVAALCAATGYLFLSGAAVATQRSYLMIALVFLGILTGRRGLTLRSVALAGFALLLLAPERLFYPGFQMSFAAVICLVAVYDIWKRRAANGFRNDRVASGAIARAGRSVFRWSMGLLVTAVVAGLATGIIGAHHFGRIAPFGILGNLLGMPVFTLIVMPMGVLALVLMPFGLAAPPLWLMAKGLAVLEAVAHYTADLSQDTGTVGNLGSAPALLLISALFAALLLPGKKRFAAAVPLLAALGLIAITRPPDIQISASGRVVAARDRDGLLRISAGRRSFAGDIWFQREGVPESAIGSRKMKSPQWRCDPHGCVVLAYGPASADIRQIGTVHPLFVAMPKAPEALEQDCRYADIIVSDLIAPDECHAKIFLDGKIREARGAMSIWLDAGQVRAQSGGADLQDKEMSAGGSPEKLTISRIEYALPDPPRPWHRQGTVTRASLRKDTGTKAGVEH